MKTQENSVTIYGVKTGESFRYIGKLGKIAKDNTFNRSDVHYQYTNDRIREIFTNETNVIPIKVVANEEWYYEKLREIVEKHGKNHPLVNAQWMLEGKRGYWEGKTRDKHTLSRLSESKFKRIVQYDPMGYHLKTWRSGKAAAIMVFKDYQIVKGSACSAIYDVLRAATLKSKFAHNSYWFKEEKLMKMFGEVPPYLDFDEMMNTQHKKRSVIRKHTVVENIRKYSVKHYDTEGHVIYTYKNTAHAAYMLKTSMSTIQKFCRGLKKQNNYYILKYGEKSLQPVNEKYPEYTIEPLRESKKKIYTKTGIKYV